MKLECSWCHKDLGTREPLENHATTHGICPPCLGTRIYPLLRQVRTLPPKAIGRVVRPPELGG